MVESHTVRRCVYIKNILSVQYILVSSNIYLQRPVVFNLTLGRHSRACSVSLPFTDMPVSI